VTDPHLTKEVYDLTNLFRLNQNIKFRPSYKRRGVVGLRTQFTIRTSL